MNLKTTTIAGMLLFSVAVLVYSPIGEVFAEQEAQIVIKNNLAQLLIFDQMKKQNIEIETHLKDFIIHPKGTGIINVKQEDSTQKIELTLEFYIVENESKKLNKIGLKKSDTLYDSKCFSSSSGDIEINYECNESTKTFTFTSK